MANMQSVCEKYAYSKVAFFVLPLVGAMFIDFVNIPIIGLFIEFISKISKDYIHLKVKTIVIKSNFIKKSTFCYIFQMNNLKCFSITL